MGTSTPVSLLRLHVDDDTYRFPPARDFTGKNVYRAVLERLESLEEIRERVRGYLRQGRIYLQGIRESLDLESDFRFELWFLQLGHIEVVPLVR